MTGLAQPQTADYRARLAGETDLAGWRNAARKALAAQIAPEQLDWEVAGRTAALDLIPRADIPDSGNAAALRLNRQHLTIVMTALLHSDHDRFALGYRLLWRIRQTPGLMGNPADSDVRRIMAMAKNVRRDIHKMHAFVRFRKTGEHIDDDGAAREQFAAWFEPEHHITAHVARFFRNRFTGMDWLIVTPQASIAWDGVQLRLGPGGQKSDVPDSDAIEDEWRSYYRSIFNPARVKVQAMKSEMPVKYWQNLPEAQLIPGLIDNSSARVRNMQDNAVTAAGPATAEASLAPAQTFPDLAALNRVMMTRNDWPWQGFTERFILGEGPANADIMLVGEQPGDVEDREGGVFVGPAGRLLDTVLAEAGVDRSQCYLTNAVKRFKYEPRGERRIHRSPSASDVAAYRDWLLHERALVQPSVTIALGATAARALTGSAVKIGAMRGLHRSWDAVGDLVITVHPSFLLRLHDPNGRAVEQQRLVRDCRHAVR
ncbi:MAG: UdgX family uracil-DNA binding protein [Pseudomonadota bacterium]